jgi:DNA-binding beta-propeller fold protein YncE
MRRWLRLWLVWLTLAGVWAVGTVSAVEVSVELKLPRRHFAPGDRFSLAAVVEAEAPVRASLVVILQVGEQLWFWPSWREDPVDWRTFDLPAGRTEIGLIEPFDWPELEGSRGDLAFWGAVLDTSLTRLLGDYAHVVWGYGPAEDTGLTIREEALWKTGPVGEGAWLLPSGRRITPLGRQTELRHLPLGMLIDPPSGTVLVSTAGRGGMVLAVLDWETGELLQMVEEPSLFLGLRLSPDGGTLWASGGGAEQVVAYDFAEGRLDNRRAFPVSGFPGGLDLSPDGGVVYVSCEFEGMLKVLDAESGAVLGVAPLGGNPRGVLRHPRREELYVSSEREGRVEIYDVADPAAPRRIAEIPVEKNPEALVLNAAGDRLYVVNADEDSLSIIDLDRRAVVHTVDLRTTTEPIYGISPNALALSPDGDRLYVAQASSNSVAVLSLPEGELLGEIPTGWYPTAVAVGPEGKRMAVANGKGVGSGSGLLSGLVNRGTISLFEIPADEELPALTEQVAANSALPGQLFEIDPATFRNPVPLEGGDPRPSSMCWWSCGRTRPMTRCWGTGPAATAIPSSASTAGRRPAISGRCSTSGPAGTTTTPMRR